MKKILISTILALLVLSGCAGEEKKVLKVFNWGAYIDETVIAEFEDLEKAKHYLEYLIKKEKDAATATRN